MAVPRVFLYKIQFFTCLMLITTLIVLLYFYEILQSLGSSSLFDIGALSKAWDDDELPKMATQVKPEWYTVTTASHHTREHSYVTLSPKSIWHTDILNDFFAEEPECHHHQIQKSNRRSNPYLLILIASAITNFDRRMAIRATWGEQIINGTLDDQHKTPESYKCIFLVGQPPTDILDFLIEEEADRYGDMLRGNYLDSYRNLTLKVLHGLNFASQSCRPKYVLKTDDDCFVNVPLILHFLKRHNTVSETLYVGKIVNSDRRNVIRNSQNKWYVSPQLYPKEFYPPYPSGHGYIISGHLLRPMMDAASKILPFPNEDAFIGVVMNAIGIHPVHTDRFALFSSQWRPCNLLYLMIIHRIKAREQKFLLHEAATALEKCPGHREVTTW